MYRHALQHLLLLLPLALAGCATERLTQFSNYAAAGSQYVQNFHQLTAQAGAAEIAADSATLIVARTQAGPEFKSHLGEYRADVQKQDSELEEYLTTLQKLDAQATLLGSYFTAVTALTNGNANTQA